MTIYILHLLTSEPNQSSYVTPHPTASPTPEYLRTDSECQGTDCGHSTAEWN